MSEQNIEKKRAFAVANWIVDHKILIAIIILLPSMILAYAVKDIEVYSRFADLLPQDHEYIKNYNKMKGVFGGANVVTMSLESNAGDIFTNSTLKKLRYLTEQVDVIPGINHYQVASIAHPKIRRVKTTPSGLIKSEPVLPKSIPEDEKSLKKLREEIFSNDVVYGTYVSSDGKAAIILAGFDEERLDYKQIFYRLQGLKQEVEKSGDVTLYITGEPMLKGWIYYHASEFKEIFSVTLLIIVVLLYLHFRSVVGVVVPLFGTGLSAIWGLGLVGWMGFNLDPLVLVVPILISARTASHCVQMMERFQDEMCAGYTKDQAVRRSMAELIVPASIAIFTDAAGLLVLAISSVPLIAKLGVFCAFWSFSNLFTVAILVPLLLSVLPSPKTKSLEDAHLPSRMMKRVSWYIASNRSNSLIIGCTLIIIAVSILYANESVVGETNPGTPILFSDSEYNVAAKRINSKFAGSNQLSIYFTSDEPHKMKDPEVLSVIEKFTMHMSNVTSFGGTRDIPNLVRSVNRLYHFDDPRWSIVPPTQKDIGNILFMYEAGAAVPGVILEYMDLEGKMANVVIFLKDATGPTVDEAITRAKSFLDNNPIEGVEYNFAGGIIGTTAAANEEVARSELLQTILIMAVVMISVMVTYRSVNAAVFVFIVLALAVLINRAYMGFRGIGLNINTLPVTAVGIGVGVDYAIYVLDRVREEVRHHSLQQAIVNTLSTTGSAVLFTAITVIGGIAYWVPGSELRFNSEMAMLLGLLMFSNMLGSITLLPLLIRIFKPNFVMREHEDCVEDKISTCIDYKDSLYHSVRQREEVINNSKKNL